ncbi:MAG: gamma-glutamyltransferase [Acidimicrobiia bacterium]|nr:gamma-glutamyltransferase [Acidimicrobiia bacterium]MDH3471541.1 gamma-glutamyltransferase [Acidimicrobiia bacterium]
MRRSLLLIVVSTLALVLGTLPAVATPDLPDKHPVAVGTGGAVATVDPLATEAGLAILRSGGNAVDAAVAAAAVLGVTEPYSAGIGGGGFMVIYLADGGEVVTIDGREEAPSDPDFDADVFLEDGVPIPFFPERITSGLAVGVPGTFATWVDALDRYGTITIGQALQPGRVVAQSGFVVDQTFADQTAGNLERFRTITSTAETFLVNGEVPEVGSVFRNQDLARTYHLLQREGMAGFYSGDLAEEIVEVVQDPPVVDDPPFLVRPGLMVLGDIEQYEVLHPDPTTVEYRGFEVFGMGPPSSGGITVGESLNIGENFPLDAVDDVTFQHHVLEATALAFADRNAYIGDDRPQYNYVPTTGLLSQAFGDERAALIDPLAAAAKPVAPGDPCEEDGSPQCVPDAAALAATTGTSTTHLVTADKWGNVVSYTLTIESTGGSAITVPGRGFLLNNELTDFNSTGDGPNLPAPGKRPRSSMSPTIVLENGAPFLAVGSPGGSTIITTVAAILQNRIDRGMSLPEAIAAPRATQRNTTTIGAEPAYRVLYETGLTALGHGFAGTSEIGAATGLEFLPDGRLLAAAEPVRRGGGDAGVLRADS